MMTMVQLYFTVTLVLDTCRIGRKERHWIPYNTGQFEDQRYQYQWTPRSTPQQ